MKLKAPSIAITGQIKTLGGGGKKNNGGTVKIYYQGAAPTTSGVAAGWTYTTTF